MRRKSASLQCYRTDRRIQTVTMRLKNPDCYDAIRWCRLQWLLLFGLVDRIEIHTVLTARDEDSTPVEEQARTQHSKHTVNTVLANAVHWCRLLKGLLRCVRVRSIESDVLRTIVRGRGFCSCKGHRQRLQTKNTLLIQSLPIQYTAVDSCRGLDGHRSSVALGCLWGSNTQFDES